jgi:hypothetical protein
MLNMRLVNLFLLLTVLPFDGYSANDSHFKLASSSYETKVIEPQKFCFDDSYGSSGMKVEITLDGGGIAKIEFFSNGVLKRTGPARWSIRSGIAEGYGENDLLTLRLSTGANLTFVVMKNIMGSFTMLIDSQENQYLRCY